MHDKPLTVAARVQGNTLISCDDPTRPPCLPGNECTFTDASAYCIPCQPNQASEIGYKCHLCQPGEHPSWNQHECENCPGGRYSEHGICVLCGIGTEPNTYAAEGAVRQPSDKALLPCRCLLLPFCELSRPPFRCLKEEDAVDVCRRRA